MSGLFFLTKNEKDESGLVICKSTKHTHTHTHAPAEYWTFFSHPSYNRRPFLVAAEKQ